MVLPARLLLIALLLIVLSACGAGTAATPTSPASLPLPAVTQIRPTAMQSPTATPQAESTPASQVPVAPTHTTAALPVMAVQVFPDPQRYTWQPVAVGLVQPLWLTHANDSSGRLFVIEQAGVVRVIKDGQLLPAPFLDLRDRVGSQGSEQGLLGLAFHPRYPENGFLYVNYTDLNGDTVIARYQVSAQDPDLANPASEKVLLRIDQPYGNHNGGMVAFGPDGYLYLGLGDGGSAGDPQGHAQRLSSLLGKILRLDVDGGDPYAIPPGNLTQPGSRPEIWAYGLRNPWRFAFDRLTGDLYIGDVGQNLWEEIDFVPAGTTGGLNFGWNFFEGNHPYRGQPQPNEVYLPPIFEYGHDQGCSVTGGVVYRGQLWPEWQGIYLLGDYCTGRVWGLLRNAAGDWQAVQLFQFPGRISSFGEDQAGEVYLVDHAGGVYRLVEK